MDYPMRPLLARPEKTRDNVAMQGSIPTGAMTVSVVIPTFDEEESLLALHDELRSVLSELGVDYEIIFVDDGSTDRTLEVLTRIQAEDERCVVVEFVRNFGKSAAYTAGFRFAKGRVVATLDADLQDDPHELPQMLAKLDEGYDLVVGWKQSRMANEFHKAIPSKFFNGLLRLLFGLNIHDSNCGFRVMRSEVAHALELYGGIYRFIPALVHSRGFRVVETPVQHRARQFGTTKYGSGRFLAGLLDLLAVRFVTAFRQRPLQFFGAIALMLFLVGGALEVYVLLMKYMFGSSLQVHMAAIVTGVMFILMALQTLVTGLIGEMLAAGTRHATFVVRRVLGGDAKGDGSEAF